MAPTIQRILRYAFQHPIPSISGKGFDEYPLDTLQNWSRASRWYYTMLAAVLVFNATFAGSAPSGIVIQLQKQFTASLEVETLIISLFIAGYCV